MSAGGPGPAPAPGRQSGRPARGRPRWTSIARHEWRRLLVVSDRRSLLVGGVLVVLLALAWPAAQERGVSTQDGIYPVAVAPGSPFAPAVASDGRFRVVGDDAALLGHGAALFIDDAPHAEPTDRGRAALHALQVATAAWVEENMRHEGDLAAAYPVRVTLIAPNAQAPQGATPVAGQGADELAQQLGADAGAAPQGGLRPGELDPPFPVRSLLLTFAYLIPMNFVGQLQAGSLHAERTRRRAVLLLAAPVRHSLVLVGRSLPYLALACGVWLAASLLIGVGPLGAVAGAVIVAFVLVGSALIGLLARSEREVTFLLTGFTTAFSTFLFLPAVFTALPPVAFLSPVAVVAASIDGTAVAWGPFLYAILPTGMCALAVAATCAGLFCEETLFSRRGLLQKCADALERLVARRGALLVAGVLLVPFALALELFVLGLVIPLGLTAVFPAVIVGAAAVEEALKRMASRAHRARTGHAAWSTGLLVGVGFFLGEKLALLVALAGFGYLPLGTATLAVFGVGTNLLLLAPLAVHTVCAAIGAISLRPGRAGAWSWLVAFVLHAAYNAAVALAAGGIL